MSVIHSNLAKSIMETLKSLPQGWVSRDAFDEQLKENIWVAANAHRLSRLDSTLAGLAREGYLELKDSSLKLK